MGVYIICECLLLPFFGVTNYLKGHFWNVFYIEMVWLTSLFLAMGGGTFIILALNMTMVSDLSIEDNR